MASFQEKWHDHVGYRIVGDGEPVFLLHGFGEDGSIWSEQITQLARAFKIIVPDFPGTGLSAAAPYRQLSIESMADLVKAIALQEQLEKLAVIGHSMGGYITLAFAERYPDMLKGFGLVHSTAYADNEEKTKTRNRSISFIAEHGSAAFLQQMIPGLYGDSFQSGHQKEINTHIESSKGIDPEVLISYTRMMMQRPDRTHVLLQSKKPVLFIIGTEDKTVNLSDSLAQCHLPSECHVYLLESGHMGMKEQSAETTIVMRKFLLQLNEN